MTLPGGLVTFLLTDVEGSTALWRDDGARAAALMKELTEVVTETVADHGGVLPLEQGEGDSAVAVFAGPGDALTAALELQRRLTGSELSVRVGVHTGLAELVDDRAYGGTAIIRSARIRDLARGGEVLVSQATAAVAADLLPADATLAAVGAVELKGFDGSEPVFRLEHPALAPAEHPLPGTDLGLPSFPTALIGRTNEIAAVSELVAGSPLVTITGAGGSGKTRVAHAIALAVGSDFEAGAAWVDLTRVADAARVPSVVLEACGQPESPLTDPLDLLVRHLAGHELLVVVDNCEHLLDATADLAARVLAAGGPSHILATSREPLGVAGETTWRIPSLDLPADAEVDVPAVAAHDGVRLFVERARAAAPDFELDEATTSGVLRVCRRLDGIPLALELAAARLRTMSVDDLADRIDDRFALLTTGARGSLERQRTLLASVQWSHDLLSDEERALLRRLSVFVAPFRLAAAEAVAARPDFAPIEVLDGLTRLVDKSLVQHQDGRYSMLETVRAFAADRAADAGELEEIRDRHLDWAVRRVRGWGYPDGLSTLEDIEEQYAEAPDLRLALEWALTRRPDAASLVVRPLGIVWAETGSFAEARRLVDQVTDRFGEGSDEWLEFIAAVGSAVVAGGLFEWIEPARAAVDSRPDLDSWVRGRLRIGWAAVDAFTGVEGAFDELDLAAEECRADGDEFGQVSALLYEAFILATSGRHGRARRLLDWLDQHTGTEIRVWSTYQDTRALFDAVDGDLASARTRLAPLLERRLPIPCVSASYMALYYGDLALAREVLRIVESMTLDGWFQIAPQVGGAVVSLLEGDYPAARDRFALAAPVPTANYARCMARCVELELHLGELDAASERLDTAMQAATALPEEFRDSGWLEIAATLLALAEDDAVGAVEHAVAALGMGTELDFRLNVAWALQNLAVAMDLAEADPRNAARFLGAADTWCDTTGASWNGPVLDAAVAELRERVDPDAYADGHDLPLADAASEALALFPERERPAFGWDSLTPAEERVVELVGEGLSNPAIADRLFVSVSTVKTHLVHAYQKLEIDSRAALAAAAATRAAGRPASEARSTAN